MKKVSFSPNSPFDFEKSLFFYSMTEASPPLYICDNKIRKIIYKRDKKYLVEISSSGTIEKPLISIEILSPKTTKVPLYVINQIKFITNSGMNLAIFYNEINQIPQLTPLINTLYGYKPLLFSSPFEALINGIIEQQISIKVANIIKARLLKYFGESIIYNNHSYYTFPSPILWETISIEKLREIGLSKQKASTIKTISKMEISQWINGLTLENIENEEKYLIKIKGIGPWTINYLRIRGLGDVNIIPVNDHALVKGIDMLFHQNFNTNKNGMSNLIAFISNQVGLFSYYVIAYKVITTS